MHIQYVCPVHQIVGLVISFGWYHPLTYHNEEEACASALLMHDSPRWYTLNYCGTLEAIGVLTYRVSILIYLEGRNFTDTFQKNSGGPRKFDGYKHGDGIASLVAHQQSSVC